MAQQSQATGVGIEFQKHLQPLPPMAGNEATCGKC